MIYILPVNVVESVRNLWNNFHTIFLGQLHDFLVSALTVRLRINLESQPSDLPFLKQLWKDLCGRPTDNKQPRGTRNKKLHKTCCIKKNICPHLTPKYPQLKPPPDLQFPSLPGVEFLQTGVQVSESFYQKSPSINAYASVVGVPGVQQEQGVDVSTVFQGSDQSRIIMQTQTLAEPVNGVMAHCHFWDAQTSARLDG